MSSQLATKSCLFRGSAACLPCPYYFMKHHKVVEYLYEELYAMTRLRPLLLLAAIVTTLLPSTVHAAGSLSVWTQSSAYKVQPSTAPGPGTSANMEGAQGAYESYQLIVHAGSAALSGVTLTASALSDGSGHTIPASSTTFYLEWMLDFSTSNQSGIVTGSQPAPAQSPTNDARIPDPLAPLVDPYTAGATATPFAVAANSNQPIWMDVAIPSSTPGGAYTGTVAVSATGEATVQVPVTLIVWNFALPDMNSVTTHFKMSVGAIDQYHAGMATCSPPTSTTNCWDNWGPTDRMITKRYEELAHTHRIDSGQDFVPGMSVQGACNLPTTADWTAYDAAIAPYMDGSYWSDGAPSARLTVPFQPGGSGTSPETCTPAQYTALAGAWAAHLKAKGWFNKAIVYAADEPSQSQYPAIVANAQAMILGDAGWKAHIMDTTAASNWTSGPSDPTKPTSASMDSVIGIYTVDSPQYDNWYDQPASAYPRQFYGRAGSPYTAYHWPTLFSQGIRLWTYTGDGDTPPYPAFATNTLLGTEPQMLMWGSWFEGASGFLYWDMLFWDPANPWGLSERFPKSGDGVLMYPGNHNGLLQGSAAPANGSPASVHIDGPVPSYRLQMIREGLQDWALFNLATTRGLGAFAKSEVALAYSQFGACPWSGCTLLNGALDAKGNPVPPAFMWKSSDTLMAQIRDCIAQAIMSNSPNCSATPTPTTTPSGTMSTATPTLTKTPIVPTSTATSTRTPTGATNTATPSPTKTATGATSTATPTKTPIVVTNTTTPTRTKTPIVVTSTTTPTVTKTAIATRTMTATSTATPKIAAPTATRTVTPTATRTHAGSPTPTPTRFRKFA